MRVLILGDINSAHIQKWCLSLSSRGLTIGIYSLSFPKNDWYKTERIHLLSEKANDNKSSFLGKLSYYRHRKLLKQIISVFKPDILHAHYASSYGMLARLSGFKPFVISVWGSDIFDFPKKNFLTSAIIRKNFKSSSAVLATGNAIKNEVKKYTDRNIHVIPFGIDIDFFCPSESTKNPDSLVIGIVKSLEDIYGIDILILAFAEVYKENKNLKLVIVGDGTKSESYQLMVRDLNISNVVLFTGKKFGNDLKEAFNSMDICVFPSRMESFGVAQLEASACGKPVVATRVGGVSEVVKDNITGLLIEKPNVDLLITALQKLIQEPELRIKMGKNGRAFVKEKFSLNESVDRMIQLYQQVLGR